MNYSYYNTTNVNVTKLYSIEVWYSSYFNVKCPLKCVIPLLVE